MDKSPTDQQTSLLALQKSRTDLQKSEFDCGKSTLDFAKALLDFPLSGKIVDVARDTANWLIRERIDERSFKKTCELAQNLAFPNDSGFELQKRVMKSDADIVQQVKKAPLKMIVSGSLGRLIGRSPELAYILTTVAALAHFHNIEHIANVLCSMVLDRGGHEEQVNTDYHVYRGPVKAVLSKVAESVQLNVVNAGLSLQGLPPELEGLHQHVLDDYAFAGIVMGIQRSKGDVVVRSFRFLADVTHWLLFHFYGTLRVAVNGNILLDKKCGNTPRVVLMLVEVDCVENARACSLSFGSVKVSIGTSTGSTTFINESIFLRGDDAPERPRSYACQQFYDLDALLTTSGTRKRADLSENECKATANAAKLVLRWLLESKIAQDGPETAGQFFTIVSKESDAPLLGSLFPCYPQWLNTATDDCMESLPVFKPMANGSDVESDDAGPLSESDFGPQATPGKVLSWLPHLEAVLQSLAKRCTCQPCKGKQNQDACQRGCLREAGMTRFCLLLAHGISDAMGAADASGMSNPEDQVQGVCALLSEYQAGIVRWDPFFKLVASTVTGVHWSDIKERYQDGETSWAAIQYGSFVVAASWLNWEKFPSSERLFSVSVIEGSIDGVKDELGLLHCEGKSEIQKRTQSARPEPTTEPASTVIHEEEKLDTTSAELLTTIFRTGPNRFRLMATISSGKALQIVDPSHVIYSYWQARRPICDHADPSRRLDVQRPCKMYDFEGAISTWSEHVENPPEAIRISKVLDSAVKINTLLSANSKPGYCILRDVSRCCLKCALKDRGSQSTPDERMISYDLSGRRSLPASKGPRTLT